MSLDFDDFSICFEGGDPIILDSQGEEHDILGPGNLHPYCPAAEDAFAMANAVSRLSFFTNPVDLVAYLRSLRTGRSQKMHFQGRVALKDVGVSTAIVMEPEIFRGFLCTMPNKHVSHGIVYRPFDERNRGYTKNQSLAGGRVIDHDLIGKRPPLVLPDWISKWKFQPGGLSGFTLELEGGVMDGQLVPNLYVPPFLEASSIVLSDESDLSQLSDDLGQRFFYRAGTDLTWLGFSKAFPAIDRLGYDLSTARPLIQGFHQLVEGRISLNANRLQFHPLRSGPVPPPSTSRVFKLKP